MIYLAAPYSHPDPAVRQQRYEMTCHATAALLRTGHTVFSPIVHSHPLVAYGLPTEWSFWSRQDQTFLEIADAVIVLTLHGWRESVGVREEMRLAEAMGIPIAFVEAIEGLLRMNVEPFGDDQHDTDDEHQHCENVARDQ